MTNRLPIRVLALAVALAMVASPIQALAVPAATAKARLQASEAKRTAAAVSHVESLRTGMGLGSRDGFAARGTFTAKDGTTIVRLVQTHEGFRVHGGQVVAQVGANGAVQTVVQNVRAGVALQGAPRIPADLASRIVLAHLAPRAQLREQPVVEQVVFPAELTGGIAMRWDAAAGRPVVDRRNTITARPSAPYVWAYDVKVKLENPVDGFRSVAYVVDGGTGKILRITDLVHHAAPSPVQGPGKGLYRGDVTVDAALMSDGTYALIDLTRGSLPNPSLSYIEPDPVSGWDPTLPGTQIWWYGSNADRTPNYMQYLFQSNTTNSWGDGLAFTDWGNSGGKNGETSGVDAMAAVTTTLDFFSNVLSRDGFDGKGTSVLALVLATDSYTRDNATWSIGGQSLAFGAGSYPYDPLGLSSMVDLDIVAHELVHGITSPGWDQYLDTNPGSEEAGISEAVSDFLAQMVKIWAARGSADPATIPDADLEWQIGKNVNQGTPLRVLDTPSHDGVSPDAWYDGVRFLDPHHSAGPVNRALYFLAKGSSANPADPTYSPYLPGGMTGIGNDTAARVLYHAMTEYLIGDGMGQWRFEDLRSAMLFAARRLSTGNASGVADAVRNAFAAINVGEGVGQSVRTKVVFENWRNGDYIQQSHMTGYSNRQVLPANETVVPRVTVLNNADTSVTWSIGGPSVLDSGITPGAYLGTAIAGGVLNSDNSWTTPNLLNWYAITATSKADPRQFAEGRAFVIGADTDMDLTTDAFDMAPISFSWYLARNFNYSDSVFWAPWVDDGDVSMWVDAFRAAWPSK